MRATLFVAALAAAIAIPAAADAQTRSGGFTGAGGHETSGTVFVNGNALSLGRNFRFDGAPDPRLAFGTARSVDRGTIFARLRRNSGSQDYSVPRSINTSGYSHVWLWCRRFNVPLGVARLANR